MPFWPLRNCLTSLEVSEFQVWNKFNFCAKDLIGRSTEMQEEAFALRIYNKSSRPQIQAKEETYYKNNEKKTQFKLKRIKYITF